jgi:hypothetical protein
MRRIENPAEPAGPMLMKRNRGHTSVGFGARHRVAIHQQVRRIGIAIPARHEDMIVRGRTVPGSSTTINHNPE